MSAEASRILNHGLRGGAFTADASALEAALTKVTPSLQAASRDILEEVVKKAEAHVDLEVLTEEQVEAAAQEEFNKERAAKKAAQAAAAAAANAASASANANSVSANNASVNSNSNNNSTAAPVKQGLSPANAAAATAARVAQLRAAANAQNAANAKAAQNAKVAALAAAKAAAAAADKAAREKSAADAADAAAKVIDDVKLVVEFVKTKSSISNTNFAGKDQLKKDNLAKLREMLKAQNDILKSELVVATTIEKMEALKGRFIVARSSAQELNSAKGSVLTPSLNDAKKQVAIKDFFEANVKILAYSEMIQTLDGRIAYTKGKSLSGALVMGAKGVGLASLEAGRVAIDKPLTSIAALTALGSAAAILASGGFGLGVVLGATTIGALGVGLAASAYYSHRAERDAIVLRLANAMRSGPDATQSKAARIWLALTSTDPVEVSLAEKAIDSTQVKGKKPKEEAKKMEAAVAKVDTAVKTVAAKETAAKGLVDSNCNRKRCQWVSHKAGPTMNQQCDIKIGLVKVPAGFCACPAHSVKKYADDAAHFAARNVGGRRTLRLSAVRKNRTYKN